MITDIVVREAPPKGKGVFALRSFRKGEFIFRCRHGRVVSNRCSTPCGFRVVRSSQSNPSPNCSMFAARVRTGGPDRIRTGDLVLDRDVC
jgi:hypothetical protein